MCSAIDLDRIVTDTVHLQSLPGAVERLLQQCHDLDATSTIRRVGDAVTLDVHGPLRPIAALRLYSALSVVLGDDPVAALRASLDRGVLGAVTGPVTSPVSFRVDAVEDRWELRDRVSEALGWVNDPGDWLVNLVRSGNLLLAQVGPLYHSRRFPALRRVPASTNPVIAALLVQLLKARSGDVVYDPFCGAGTLLVEAAALDVDLVLFGSELSRPALAEALANLAMLSGAPESTPGSAFRAVHLFRADATRLPVAADSVDRVVSNLPFGKRVGSHAVNVRLYPAFVAELNRVLRVDGRAVLLTDDKNLLRRSVEATPGTRIIREVQVATGGNELHPTAFVLERTRTARRSVDRARYRAGTR